MAALSGDIIRITDFQTLLGQQVLNVYNYAINDTTLLTGDYLGFIAGIFDDVVVTPVLVAQSQGVVHTHLYLENLSNGVDIRTYDDGYPREGSQTDADNMPPYVSFGFQLLREERATRNGYKRVAGVVESQQEDGVFVGDPSYMEDIEEGFAADLVSGIVHVCNPIILRDTGVIPLVDPVFSHIGGALFKGIGTQNTRKLGRGI